MPNPVELAVANTYRRLTQKDIIIQRRMAEAYAQALKAVIAEHAAFAKYVAAQKAKGAPVSPSWASREARYLSLQSQLYKAVHDFGGLAALILDNGLSPALIEALERTRTEAAAQAPHTPGLTYPGFGPETWAVINHKAIQAAMALVDQHGSPLRALFERDFPETALAIFRKEWAAGLLSGKNPLNIARNLAKQIGTLTLGRAQLIARTEFHRAYREGKREQIRNSDILSGWKWRCALDGRSCAVCFGMHGTFHTADETLEGHPGCRCVMLPWTKGWDELGFGNIADTRPKMETGDEIFARLPADMQLKKLGPSRFKMYQEGMPLSSMITRREHPLWGGMLVLEPLAGLRRLPGGGGFGDPINNPDDFAKYMMSKHGVAIDGILTAVQRRNIMEAFDDYGSKLGIDWKTMDSMANGFHTKDVPDLGAHPLNPGSTIPGYYSPAKKEIVVAKGAADRFTGRTTGYGIYAGQDGFKALVTHELGHALHASLNKAALSEWRAIHLGTGSSATIAQITKALNSTIQKRAEAKRKAELWRSRVGDPAYDGAQDWVRKQIDTYDELYSRYTQQIEALKAAKKGMSANSDIFPSSYAENNEFEDFAESAWRFINTPEWLAKNAPARYGFFTKYFGGKVQ